MAMARETIVLVASPEPDNQAGSQLVSGCPESFAKLMPTEGSFQCSARMNEVAPVDFVDQR